MINISNVPLSANHISVLSKGLTFAPTNPTKEFQTKIDLFKFHRNLQLKVWYHSNTNQVASQTLRQGISTPFKPKSTFTPNISNPTLGTFFKKVTHDVDKLFTTKRRKNGHNLTKEETEALNWLSKNDDIIVKRADKGGAVVVWGREQYITEAKRQLDNSEYYQPLPSNPIDQIKRGLGQILLQAKTEDWITQKEHDFLLSNSPRIPCFYMLPKIHKDLSNPPGRPIISGNESVTEPASKYVDFYIKSHVLDLPSFIQDSTSVLNKIKEIANIGSSLLVTMDVESLYTNIDHKDGLNALSHYLEYRPTDLLPPAAFILQLAEWTLNNNVFLFQNQFYKQIKGTAMGACFAPNYSNLFMGLWEETFVYSNLNTFAEKIKYYGRYIDDILLIWSGSESELSLFHSYLNNTNPNLKLNLEFSHTQISFLDLKISKDLNGDLHTSIFRKPTDRNTILKADSFHPPWLIKNIPYGQFQRLRRICDSDEDFELNAQEMTDRFLKRGYNDKTIHAAYNRAKSLPREQLLDKKQDNAQCPNQVYFVTQYSSEAHKIKQIIKKNWDILTSDVSLREALPDSPTITFRRAPTLSDKLVRSHLPPVQTKTWLDTRGGNHQCGNCNHCGNMKRTNSFMDVKSGQEYTIRNFMNCNTTFVVYRLECPCGCFYIGRTKRKLKTRLAEHKYAIRTANPNYPMAVHYKDVGHGSCDTLRISGIEHIKKTIRGGDRLKKLLQRESFWIYTLKATTYPGLNLELDFSPFL